MILLPPENKILGDLISAEFAPLETDADDEKKVMKRPPVDVRLCDFDDVSYHVKTDDNNPEVFSVSMALPCYREIQQRGGEAALNKNYGAAVVDSEQGYDLTLRIDKQNLPFKQEEIVNKIAALKPTIVGGVFDYYFDALLQGKPQSESFRFNLRRDTQVFLLPRADRVVVIFGVDFSDKTDLTIAKVFLQEFVVARQRLGAAPPCAFTVAPPLELKEFGITEATGNLGFVSFSVMKSHLESGRKDKVIAVLQSFRNYLQFHLKCSKSYFHSRMRARVVSLLKVLNRAKVEPPQEKKEMKTMSGRTFTRQ